VLGQTIICPELNESVPNLSQHAMGTVVVRRNLRERHGQAAPSSHLRHDLGTVVPPNAHHVPKECQSTVLCELPFGDGPEIEMEETTPCR